MPTINAPLNLKRQITSSCKALCPTPLILGLAIVVSAPFLSASLTQAGPAEDYAEGIRLFASKDFAGAAKVLKTSFDAEPAQRTLFAWAQAERLQGNCEHSAKLFSQYIANGANQKQSQAAFELMSDCVEREPAAPVVNTDSDKPETIASQKEIEQDKVGNDTLVTDIDISRSSNSDIPSPWYKDWVGMSLLGAGGASLILGGAMYADALSIESDAQNGNEGRFTQAKKDATNRRELAVGASITGGVLITGALVYYYLTSPSDSETSGLSLQLGNTSTSVSYAGSF